MIEYLHFVFSDFWIAVGNLLLVALILQGVLTFVYRMYKTTLNFIILLVRGYPNEWYDLDDDLSEGL